MELKYKNWNDISVNIFHRLQEVLTTEKSGDELIDNINSNIMLLSILCDVDEDVISNLSPQEFNGLLQQTKFLNEMPKVKIKDNYTINGKKYRVHLNMEDMTMAQYIDFQTYCKDKDKYTREILSCFLIPKDCKYGDNYNIGEVIDEIGEHLSIVDAHSIMFFFTLLYRTLTKTTLTYLEKKLKKMSKKMTEEQRKKTEEAITTMREIMDLVQSGGISIG